MKENIYVYRTCFHIRRHAKQQHQAGHAAPTLPTLPSTYSVHDFHNNYQTSGHYPGMHFHLAASINAETGTVLILYYIVYQIICSYLMLLSVLSHSLESC